MRNYIKEMMDDLRDMEDEKSMPRESDEYNYDVLNDIVEKGRFNSDESWASKWILGSIVVVTIILLIIASVNWS